MGKLSGIISKIAGSAGNITFRRLNGETVVSEKVTQIRNPRSEAQMRTRTKFTNIVAMYKGIRPLINYGFESKPKNLSDYNMFVKVNMQRTPVYLTKQQVAGGACVAAPYQFTQGSLPAIVVTGSGNGAKTDIYLGGITLGSATTVAQFAQAVVENNADYRYGDQISFFRIAQKVNEETGIPYCQFSASKVVLDAADTETKLWDAVNRVGFSAVDSVLGHSESNFVGAFGWVHSRKTDGKTLVSSQSLVAVNDALLAEHQGDMAYNLAKSSYGQSTEAFLVPDGESTAGGGNAPSGGGNSGGGGGNDSL
jgi:hypothetical protein